MKHILKKPLITEKSNEIAEKRGQFTFVVDKKATKTEIKAEIELIYNVKVDRINTMIYGPRTKTKYTKKGFIDGKVGAYKKAIVTLLDGGTIDFYSNL